MGSLAKLISLPLSLRYLCLKCSTMVRWGESKYAVQRLLALHWKVLGATFWFKQFPLTERSLEVQKLENTQCCWHLQYRGSGVAILKYRHLDNDLSSGRVNHMWTCPMGLFTLDSAAAGNFFRIHSGKNLNQKLISVFIEMLSHYGSKQQSLWETSRNFTVLHASAYCFH